ncbi:hypothetical protein [Vibrio cholerae]|uniref:hypothetical protein n=1 Tax=Vibrio cholerae TaxID=666 RepID=UPI001E454CCF|nr:hypothetical protein [Vibrio cholerae]MCD6704282.1 hypothetical protein [Vibrio cholerae]
MKKWLLSAILVVLSIGGATAKVTYDDAIKSDQQLNAANPHTQRTHGFTSAELSLQTTTADNRTWHNVSYARAINTQYRNSTSGQIVVTVTPSGNRWEEMTTYVNGVLFGRVYSGDFGGGATVTMPVPAGATYQVNLVNHRGQGHSILSWLELR